MFTIIIEPLFVGTSYEIWFPYIQENNENLLNLKKTDIREIIDKITIFRNSQFLTLTCKILEWPNNEINDLNELRNLVIKYNKDNDNKIKIEKCIDLLDLFIEHSKRNLIHYVSVYVEDIFNEYNEISEKIKDKQIRNIMNKYIKKYGSDRENEVITYNEIRRNIKKMICTEILIDKLKESIKPNLSRNNK